MPHILLIEDNPGDAVLIQELLKDEGTLSFEYVITHVERTADAIEILNTDSTIDVILSDITLPDSRGTETLQLLSRATSNLPVLFMTGTNDEALAIQALKQGAQDYLVKGQATGYMLSRSLQYAIERKRAQNEVEAIKMRELANLERIRLLAREKQQLISLNKSKDEFVSIASHQLRTPATAVKQYLGIILDGYAGSTIDPTVYDVVRAANESNERQLKVIEELLKTAQLDSARMALDIQNTNITSLLSEIVANQMPVIRSRRQTVAFNDAHDFFAHVDVHEIRLVFENLLENASKYSPNGTTITIVLKYVKNRLIVEISDQGVGIAIADQKKIFDKFTRVDNDMSDTVSGTGLGLYWARRIIKLHKGSIGVRSHPKQGSVFSVRLPK